MQTYFANILCFYCSILHLLRWNISHKLALHHDKNKPLSHTTKNTDRTTHLSNKTKCNLFTTNAYAAFFNRWKGNEYRLNLVKNALAWDRNVAWWTVSFRFGKRLKKLKTNRSPRDLSISCLSIYYNIKSIFLDYLPIEEWSTGIAVNK